MKEGSEKNNFFANTTLTGKAKIVFYSIGFLGSIFFLSPEEIKTATHSPPFSIVIPFVISITGILWLLFDLLIFLGNKMIYKTPKNLQLNIQFHLLGISFHLAILASIISYAFKNA